MRVWVHYLPHWRRRFPPGQKLSPLPAGDLPISSPWWTGLDYKYSPPGRIQEFFSRPSSPLSDFFCRFLPLGLLSAPLRVPASVLSPGRGEMAYSNLDSFLKCATPAVRTQFLPKVTMIFPSLLSYSDRKIQARYSDQGLEYGFGGAGFLQKLTIHWDSPAPACGSSLIYFSSCISVRFTNILTS